MSATRVPTQERRSVGTDGRPDAPPRAPDRSPPPAAAPARPTQWTWTSHPSEREAPATGTPRRPSAWLAQLVRALAWARVMGG